jgi:hypothetical protein
LTETKIVWAEARGRRVRRVVGFMVAVEADLGLGWECWMRGFEKVCGLFFYMMSKRTGYEKSDPLTNPTYFPPPQFQAP